MGANPPKIMWILSTCDVDKPALVAGNAAFIAVRDALCASRLFSIALIMSKW